MKSRALHLRDVEANEPSSLGASQYMRCEKQVIDSAASRIVFLDGLRGFAIAMVVATHAIAYAQVDKSLTTFLSFWIQSLAVPPFFLADGFLFVRSLERNRNFSFIDYCARSARRLLLPWLLFSLFYMVFRAGFELVVKPHDSVVIGQTFGELLKVFYYSSISAQLYFLPALFLMRSASFATKYLASLHPVCLIGVWLLYVMVWQFWSTGNDRYESLDPVVNAFWGMQYYLLGMALSLCECQLNRKAFLLAGLSFAVLVGVKVGAPAWAVFAQNAYVCCIFFVFLGLAGQARPFVSCGTYTMGIYLLHAPIIVKVVSLLSLTMFPQPGIVRYLAIASATFLISAIAVKNLSRFSWWRFMLGEVATPLRATRAV